MRAALPFPWVQACRNRATFSRTGCETTSSTHLVAVHSPAPAACLARISNVSLWWRRYVDEGAVPCAPECGVGSRSVRRLAKHAARLIITLTLGGFLGATLVRVAPGYGMDEEDLDSRLTDASHAALRQERKSDEHLPRYYLRYLQRLMHGDLGTSAATHQPVRQLVQERLPETLASILWGLTLAWSLGLGLAAAGVMWRGAFIETGANVLSALVICIPAAVLGLLFVIARGPARLAVWVIVFPRVYQYARNLLRHSAALPHVLTARAKGLSGLRILAWHIVPASGRPLMALAGISLCMALAAAIPVEAVCDLPGIGQLAWQAALSRDMGMLVNLTMLVTLITLAANSAAELIGRPMRSGDA